MKDFTLMLSFKEDAMILMNAMSRMAAATTNVKTNTAVINATAMMDFILIPPTKRHVPILTNATVIHIAKL